MKYRLDVKILKKKLSEQGYKSVSEFAVKTGLHRNTLQNLLSGKNVFTSSMDTLTSHLNTDPLELIIPQSPLSFRIKHIEELKNIVGSLVKQDKKLVVVLLGSRAKQKAKEYSDWDLGVFKYPTPLSGLEYLKLKRMVDEKSENLVRKVDLVNLNQAPAWFFEEIDKNILYLDGHHEAYTYLMGVLDGIQREKVA